MPSPPPVFDEEATLRRRGTKTIVAFAPAPPSSGREAHFREVYDSFLDTKRACGEPTDAMTFERFLAKVEENERNLRSDPSVIDVRFSVYIKDGKAALKAKVVRDE